MLALFASTLFDERSARACASCNCGDTTLTALGLGKPYKNRVRLALELSYADHTSGAAPVEEHSYLLRTAATLAWSPNAWITTGVMVPMVSAWMRGAGQANQSLVGLGDAELWARGVVYRDRAFSTRHMVSLLGGLKFPTGPRLKDAHGYPFPEDDQPGSGSWDPYAGLSYGWYGESASAFVSASYRYPTEGWRGFRRGMNLGASAGAQLQPIKRLAVALSMDFRWAEPDSMPSVDEHGRAVRIDVPDSGGSRLALTPAVLVSPVDGWLLKLAAQVQVASWLRGHQAEGTAVFLSTVIDLN